MTIFGKPTEAESELAAIEGHHLSLNFTIANGQVQSATPAFFGANAAELKIGERKGQHILKDVEDLARELYKSLDEDQKAPAGEALRRADPTRRGGEGRRASCPARRSARIKRGYWRSC